MSDRIIPNDTLASLESEARMEPYRLGVAGKIITFPDPMEMEFEATDEFLNSLRNASSSAAVLRSYLSEKDYHTLKAAAPTGKAVAKLMERVLRHYEVLTGDAGEGPTSGTA